MKKGVIIGGIVAGLALLAYHGYQKTNQFLDSLEVKLKSFKIPSIQSGIATVPLTLTLINPVDLAIALKSLNVIVSLKQADGTFKQVGTATTGSFSIPAVASKDISLSPQLNLNNINPFQGKNIKDIFTDLFSLKPLFTFKIEWSGIYTDPVVGNIPFSGSEESQIIVPI